MEQEKMQGGRVLFPEDTAHYMKRVLRLHVGDPIEIASEGKNYRAKISRLDTDAVEAELLAETASFAEPPLDIYLLQGLPKGDKLELIIQKSVELGIKAVYPMYCRRSIPAWPPQKDTGQARTAAKSGCCGRSPMRQGSGAANCSAQEPNRGFGFFAAGYIADYALGRGRRA